MLKVSFNAGLSSRRYRQVALLAAFTAGLFCSTSAYAAEYYVATNGSDSNNGSQAAPFKSIQKAVDIVRAGDTVIIRAGRHQSFTIRGKNGSAGAPITFRGEPGAIVDRHPKGPAGYWVISISGGSYITIDGLELTDSNPTLPAGMCAADTPETEGKNGIVLWGEPHHIIIKNMNIHHVRSQAILGIAHDSQFINNHLHDNGFQGTSYTKQAYGVYLMGKRLVIAGNRIHNNSGNGIRTGNIASSGVNHILVDSVIENNIVYNNGGKFPHTNGNTGECRILDHGIGIVIYGGSGNIIRNNIVYGNVGSGIQIFQDLTVSNKPNLVYNNTVYKNQHSGIWSNGVNNTKDITEIKNNIIYLNASRDGTPIAGPGITSNNLTTDPKFVNPDAGDFGLQEGSPALDKGVTLAQVTADFTGKARPEAAAYDIGAFEGAGSKANVLPGVAAGIPAGVGGVGGTGGGSLGLGNCLQ
jgi:parallel beta-helix repeat protein